MANEAREPKRTRGRINPFDVIIFILILCLLGTLGYRIYDGVSTESADEESKYFITFTCEGVYSSLADYLTKDTAVYLADGSVLGYIYLGKDGEYGVELVTEGAVTDSTESEPEENEENEENVGTEESDTEASLPTYQRVTLSAAIRLSHVAVQHNGGEYYSVGDRNISVGSSFEVYTDKAVFTLVVTGVSPIEK